MALASTSKLQLVILKETVTGVCDSDGIGDDGAVFLRSTGESLSYGFSSETSKEINATRQVGSRVVTDANVDGSINIELSFHEYDDLFEALLAGTFDTTFAGATGVKAFTSCAFSTGGGGGGGTITLSGADVGGFAGLEAGQWIKVTGHATPSLNRLYKIIPITTSIIVVDALTPVAEAAAAGACSFSGCRLENGVAALQTFTIEKGFTDVNQFFMYRGMAPTGLSLDFSAASVLKGDIKFLGLNVAEATATTSMGIIGAAQGNPMMNSVTGIGDILVNGAILADTYIKSAKVTIDAKLRAQKAIGTLGAVGIGEGTFDIGGELVIYLADATVYNLALAQAPVSLEIPVTDADGSGYVFVFDNVYLDVPTVQAGSMDADVELSCKFTAVAPVTATDKMLHIDRVGAAIV